MISDIDSATVVSLPTDNIDAVVRKMAKESKKVEYAGLSVVLDEEGVLLGVVTDGDIRRAYASDISFFDPVSRIMTKNPITLSSAIPDSKIAEEVIRLVQLSSEHDSESVYHIMIVDDNGKLIRVVNFLDALQSHNGPVKKVVIFGLGFVGLTLAVSLANKGHQVTGVDIDKQLITNLRKGIVHIHEPSLENMLKTNIKNKKISFSDSLKDNTNQVYIVAVGTPLDTNGLPSLSALNGVLTTISRVIKKRDQVMLRSTVPVGTTRDLVIPYLEKKSSLRAGSDFFVTFAPERTVEGNAMQELKSLPQVLGGYTPTCLKNSADFWATLTPFIVHMESLEASELVKLANNTFRDISFAFSNELALLADRFNVDAFDLVRGANDGYLRNTIPLPSPGVGGYCLTKDPILFSSTCNGIRDDAVLGISSRKINEKAALYPVKLIKRYVNRVKIRLSDLKILIIGVAFKGVPETNDVRGSVSIDVFKELKHYTDEIYAWDAVVSKSKIKKIGFKTFDNLDNAIKKSNVILILNNHPENIRSCIYIEPKKTKLIFDGWNQMNKEEVEKIDGMLYATMGYMTS